MRYSPDLSGNNLKAKFDGLKVYGARFAKSQTLTLLVNIAVYGWCQLSIDLGNLKNE